METTEDIKALYSKLTKRNKADCRNFISADEFHETLCSNEMPTDVSRLSRDLRGLGWTAEVYINPLGGTERSKNPKGAFYAVIYGTKRDGHWYAGSGTAMWSPLEALQLAWEDTRSKWADYKGTPATAITGTTAT